MRRPPRRLRSAHGNDRPPSAPRSPVHAGGDADRRISSNVGGPAPRDVPPPRATPHRVRARAGPPVRSLPAGARRGPDTARRCAADRAWVTIFQQPVYSAGALARADRGSVCNGIATGREEFLRGEPDHVEASHGLPLDFPCDRETRPVKIVQVIRGPGCWGSRAVRDVGRCETRPSARRLGRWRVTQRAHGGAPHSRSPTFPATGSPRCSPAPRIGRIRSPSSSAVASGIPGETVRDYLAGCSVHAPATSRR